MSGGGVGGRRMQGNGWAGERERARHQSLSCTFILKSSNQTPILGINAALRTVILGTPKKNTRVWIF